MLLILVVVGLMGWVASTGYNPLKIVDPSDQRFDPSKFQFEDYLTDREMLHAALEVLLPVGLSKQEVERRFVEKAGGEVRLLSDEQYMIRHPATALIPLWHSCPAKRSWAIRIFYKDGSLQQFELRGPC